MSPGTDTLPASTGTRIQYWRSFAGGPGMVSRCQLESWNDGAAHGGSSPACQRQIPVDGAVHGSEVTLLSSCEQRLTDSHQPRQPDAQPCALSLGVRSEAECEATNQCSKNDWRNAFLGLGFSMTRLQQSRNSTSMLFLSTLLCSSAPPPLRWRTAPSLLFPLLTTLI